MIAESERGRRLGTSSNSACQVRGSANIGVQHEEYASPRHRGWPHPERADAPRAADDRTPGPHIVTFATSRPREGALTRAGLATTFDDARSLVVPGPLRRAATVIGDLFAVLVIALCIPVVILAIGTPIALCVRFLLWVVGML